MGIKKNPKKPSENTIFQESDIFGWLFGFFSFLVCRIELILFPLLLYLVQILSETGSETFFLTKILTIQFFSGTNSENFYGTNFFETSSETFSVPNLSDTSSNTINKNEKFPGTAIPRTGTSHSASSISRQIYILYINVIYIINVCFNAICNILMYSDIQYQYESHFNFYRTQVNLGSDLWVRMSVTD